MNNQDTEIVAMRGDFDGYGYMYIDNGHGSNWQERHPDWEPLYAAPCKFPTCQTEEYQQKLADDVAIELVGTPDPTEAHQLLTNLVNALRNAHISVWQTTAGWDKQLNEADDYLTKHDR